MDDEGDFERRGWIASLIPARRTDLFMLLLLLSASGAVLVNALALQKPTRAPQLPALNNAASDAVPLPVPAPDEVRRAAPPATAPDMRVPAAAAAPSPAAPLPPAKPAAPRVDAAPAPRAEPSGIGSLAAEVTGSVRPPADVAVSPRVMDVQKALAKLGYGPIRIDGRTGAATREAIERFERDRRLPISGEVSDKLVRELNAVSGLTIQ